MTNQWMLVVAGLLPAIVLCIYVFIKDRVEKEPIGLLLRLLFIGAFCCYPAALLESALCGQIDVHFASSSPVVYTFVKMFFGVALVEEGLKLISLNWITRKNSEFDCLFDGLIYAIFVSLGFAALENVLYVLEYGWANAVVRAIMSVPGHMFFAVMMGYNYSLLHIYDEAREMEIKLRERGVISNSTPLLSGKKYAVGSIVMPIIAHGTYNFCCTLGGLLPFLCLIAFLIYMYIHCFTKIKKMSAKDGESERYAKLLLIKKYPTLIGYSFDEL